jgi:hypothetical protein
MRRLLPLALIAAFLPLSLPSLFAQGERKVGNGRSSEQRTRDDADPASMGHPLSYWIKVLRTREMEESELAFDAIVDLGPRASRAVPELTQILEVPFVPIKIGTDSRSEIKAKLIDIDLRAGAIDSLGAIGPAAASAAQPAIRWGLTVRVVPANPLSARDRFFIELVGVDVLERMRAAGTVSRFGIEASAAVQELVESPDTEKQKFAAAILNEGAVMIATELMQSDDCKERMVGLSLLSGMWPVVPRDHLTMLKESLSCEGFGESPQSPRNSSSHRMN